MKNNTTDTIREFNEFIKKWTGADYQHLLDTDDNDGERFRQLLSRTIGYSELLEICDSVKKPLTHGNQDTCPFCARGLERKCGILERIEEENDVAETIKQIIISRMKG